MTLINTTGNKTHKDVPELAGTGKKKAFMFSGNTRPTTLALGVTDEAGVFVPFDDATVTALPTSFVVEAIPPEGLTLEVTGGSPDFTIESFNAGPLSQ